MRKKKPNKSSFSKHKKSVRMDIICQNVTLFPLFTFLLTDNTSLDAVIFGTINFHYDNVKVILEIKYINNSFIQLLKNLF